MVVGGGSVGKGLAAADEVVVAPSTMDAAFEEQLKDGAEAFEFQAEVLFCVQNETPFLLLAACCVRLRWSSVVLVLISYMYEIYDTIDAPGVVPCTMHQLRTCACFLTPLDETIASAGVAWLACSWTILKRHDRMMNGEFLCPIQHAWNT